MRSDLDGIRNSKGGLFDIPAEHALQEDVGLKVVYINPQFPAYFDGFVIECLQRNYRGEIIYRGVGGNDKHGFGTPIHPEDVRACTDAEYDQAVEKCAVMLAEINARYGD